MSIGVPTKEAKEETETHPVTTEAKISVQYNLKLRKLFCSSYSLSRFGLFFQ